MNDLRLVLLVFGLCVIAGIYLWGLAQNRRQQRQRTIQEPQSSRHTQKVRLAAQSDDEVDYSSALRNLSQSLSTARGKDTGMPATTINPAGIKRESEAHEDLSEPGIDTGNPLGETEDAALPAPAIISLNIIPRAKPLLQGPDIVSAVETVDMTYGEMQIFHHNGIGDMKMDRALFSLASITEPGYFEMDEIDEFRTHGLILFMCLPCPFDAQLVFELMLNTAQRLAVSLGADVCDERRELLNEQKIESIRKKLEVTEQADH